MIELGIACLVGGLIAFLYGAGAALYGGFTRDRRWVDSSRRAVYAAAILLTVCVVVLEAAFLRDDFSVELVADHSSTTTPTLYKMTAMWGSQGGSLLLWAWVLSLAASGVLFATRHKHREVVPWATAVLCGLGIFFTGLMLIAGGANPFARLSPVPAEGVGLNPLLRHPAMAIHPPMLYSGYVLFSIPFAFAIGALVARRLDASWIRSTRRFGLLAWIFLTCGVLLGAGWSYMELGWGGYWGWDPVENASLMPWLVGHGVPALDHGPGAPRHAEGLERVADLRHVRALPARHVPGALRDPRVDPRVRRLHGGDATAGADRRRPGRLDRADRLAPARAARGAPASSHWPRARPCSWSTTCCWSASA